MTVPKIWNTGERIDHGDLNTNFAATDMGTGAAAAAAAAAAAIGTMNGTAITALQTKVATLPTSPAAAALDMGARQIVNLAPGTTSTDGARLDQMMWRVISRINITSAKSSVVLSLPSGFYRFRLDLEAISPAASGFPYIEFSFNGGTSYVNGPSDYAWVMIKADTALTPIYANGSTLVQIGPNGLTSGQSGWIEFTPDDKTVFASWWGSGANLEATTTQGRCNVAGTPTHVLFALSSGAINAGRIRFSGAV